MGTTVRKEIYPLFQIYIFRMSKSKLHIRYFHFGMSYAEGYGMVLQLTGAVVRRCSAI